MIDIEHFTQIEESIIKEINNKLSARHGMVYFILYSHKNSETDLCFPSYTTLQKECNMSRDSISKYIKELKNSGYISIIKKENKNNYNNNYIFNKKLKDLNPFE